MRHILSGAEILLLPASSIAQNNPDSEYKQYCARIGVECELATEPFILWFCMQALYMLRNLRLC